MRGRDVERGVFRPAGAALDAVGALGSGVLYRTALALLLLGPAAARAHVTWADGTPVPEWVTRACCGPSDAHHLTPEQVHRVVDGYRIDGYPNIVYDAQVLPSQDGEYWAFYSDTQDADGVRLVSSVFCFFAPSWG